jgi:predicted alpha/beta hydrolase family esterase
MPANVLLFPGLETPDWMQHWTALNPDFTLLYPLDEVQEDSREEWVEFLDDCIRECPKPPIVVAHSLAVSTLVWWAREFGLPLKAALLVGALDHDSPTAPQGITGFVPLPLEQLNFPSVLVGSRNDPFCAFERAGQFAAAWGSQFIDGGYCGHWRQEDNIADWSSGKFILDQLIAFQT